jgi:hypothetical protein
VAAIGAVIALAACDRARAQAGPEGAGAARLAGVVTVPADWRAQPAIADEAARAAGADADAAAWGEPGLGCFAVVVSARAAKQRPEDALEELRATLTESLGLDGWTATNPTDVRGRLARGGLRGELRGGVVPAPPKGALVTMAACFYNQRDPDACRAQCQAVLESLDASKVKP